ncbi:hypothetical protein NBT05_16385 [Aquimarina sp. ERC-38]|uniref:hypothetical protein n=1 Tax=Aquimarina sp. ERC-38 TaxID=2949996 RepID=UPI0022484477|nr:hypothetical protein [Aquimarina sp. ERC-38]UZO80515.1 hypothetical protein NBT05_16385 [Aquimarina sp. ERC-38]
MKQMLLIPISVFIVVSSCGVSQEEYEKLKKENELLKNQIEECNLEVSEMLSLAKISYERLEYKKSSQLLELIIAKYPNSKEADQSAVLLKKVEKDLAATQRALEKDKLIEESNLLLGEMNKRIDEASGATFYTDKAFAGNGKANSVYLYAGSKKRSKPWLGLAINRFSKDNWLHTQKVMFNVDGTIYNINEEVPDDFKERKESDGYREWIDRVVGEQEFELIKKITTSEQVTLTLIGSEVSEKRIMTPAEKEAIKNVLNVYTILGGT